MEISWREPLNTMRQACQDFRRRMESGSLDRAQSLLLLLDFADLLGDIQSCLEYLPDIEQVARPGATLKEALQTRAAEIGKQAECLHALREELKQMADLEAQWGQQEEEIRSLQEQRERLRRLQHMVESGDLEQLREQVAVLKHNRALMEAGDLERALREEAQGFLRLSEDCLQRLDPEIRLWLQRAIAQEQQLAESQARLREAQKRYRDAWEAWQQCREELERYEEANRRIAQALPPGSARSDILEALDQIRALLQATDEALRSAMEENERQHRREPITF